MSQLLRLADSLFTLVWSILAIELTIHWNNITNMYTIDNIGQYVPLAVGLGGFVRLIYRGLKLWLVNMVLCHSSMQLVDIQNPNKENLAPDSIELIRAQSHEAAASGGNVSDFLDVAPSKRPLERPTATF